MLQISNDQDSTLSADLVKRHAQALEKRVADRLTADGPAPADAPPGLARLKALHAVLRNQLDADAGDAAPIVAVDLDHCARQLASALTAGAMLREPAAAALMWAAALLGARWMGDERLCAHGPQDDDVEPLPAARHEATGTSATAEPLPEPADAAGLRDWAEGHWGERFRLASRRSEALRVPTRYAIEHAMSADFAPAGLRTIADAVFGAGEVERLTGFLETERGLLVSAALDARSLGDPRIERLCIGGDLVYGLGRFVRLAQAFRSAPPDIDHLEMQLREALNALAEQAH